MFVNRKEFFSLRPTSSVYLGSLSNGSSCNESIKVSLNGNMQDFLVHYNSVDQSYILNIYK